MNLIKQVALNDACKGVSIENLLLYVLEKYGEKRFRLAVMKVLKIIS